MYIIGIVFNMVVSYREYHFMGVNNRRSLLYDLYCRVCLLQLGPIKGGVYYRGCLDEIYNSGVFLGGFFFLWILLKGLCI